MRKLSLVLLVLNFCMVYAADSSVDLCGTEVYPSNTGFKVPSPILKSNKVWQFVSEPGLHPMKIKVSPYLLGLLANGKIFNAPYAASAQATYGQSGALITNNKGTPIWFRPLKNPSLMNTDFRVQKLNGSNVLTFWQGTISTPPAYTNVPTGAAEPGACYYILNNKYKVIKTVKAFKGFTPDVHEFLITPKNTALFFATKVVPMDLSPYGGPTNGAIHDFSIQEVDLATNKLIFFWDAKDHISLKSTHIPASTAKQTSNVWDPYHLNSLGLINESSEDLLFSSRNTWTIYRLHKPNGKFVWKLNGNGKGDFKIPNKNAHFSWQHDARFLPGNIITMFDDSCCKSYTNVPAGTAPSHGLVLHLDLINKIASFDKSYYHDKNLYSSSQGNTQTLSNGSKFIGFGSNGYFTEYAEPGNTKDISAANVLYNAKMPSNNISYRSYRNHWTATPDYPPSIVVRNLILTKIVYASWNGATEVKRWLVYAGLFKPFLKLVAIGDKKDFETAILVNSKWRFFQVKAVDKEGRILGKSKIIFNP